MNRSLWDVAVSLAIIGVAGLVYRDALGYRPGSYDPLGSGAMPRMVAIAIIVLAVVAIVQSILAYATRPARPPARTTEDFVARPWLALAIFFYLVAAAALLYLRVPFGIVGTLLLFFSTLSIKRGDPRIILPAALCSTGFGFGLGYLFGGIFGVDLP